MRLKTTQSTQHTFAQTVGNPIRRSVFDRGHGIKTTWGTGGTANTLVPIYVDEMLPGDTFVLRLNAFARMIPTIVPVMDNIYMDFFFFAVPNRILWSNWYKFMGAQDNPGDSTSYTLPVITTPGGGYPAGALGDWFGLPTSVASMPNVSALPFRAYNRIYNDWFKDQNLINNAAQLTGDGPDAASNYPALFRTLRHDYFTSCLPLPQKAPAVNLPLPSAAPLTYAHNNPAQLRTASTGALYSGGTAGLQSGTLSAANISVTTAGTTPLDIDVTGNTVVNASTWATVNQLRQSVQLQRFYERDNRGGTRLTEVIRAHFGVVSPDARQQRSEYLGGGSVPVILNPVAQTSVTGTTPQGNLAAYGTASASGRIGFTYSATEHMTLIGLVTARADLTYQQGIERMWSRQTRVDFYWPAFAHLGEQGVLNQEIYVQGTSADSLVFGYQERYGEYRYKPSRICGQFRSNYTTPLDMWHMAIKFNSLPTLNSTFLLLPPPTNRVVAVTTTDPFLLDCYFDLKCARPMPLYSIPGGMDRF